MPNDFAASIADVKDLDLPWDIKHPQEAEARFREEIAKRIAGGVFDPHVLELMTQIARAQSLAGKVSDAERTLAEVATKLSQTTEIAPRLRYLLELGRLFTLQKTPSRAHAIFLEVWQHASEAKQSFFAIDAAQMLAIVDHRKSGEWLLKALRLVDESSDPRIQAWHGELNAALGWHFYDLLQLEKARQSFEQAIIAFEREGWPKKRILASCGLSRVLRAEKRFEEAYAIQQPLVAEMNTSTVKHSLVYEEVAECLHALKRGEEATEYFARAYELLAMDAWHKDNNPSRMTRLKKLGKVK